MLRRTFRLYFAWLRDGVPDLAQSLVIVIAFSLIFHFIDAPTPLAIAGAVAAGSAWYIHVNWRRRRKT